MGLLIDTEVEKGCRIGLWDIVEDYETLFRITYLNGEDIRRLNAFRSLNRKMEWLSVRALLQLMTRPDARIVYNGRSRKPYMDDGAYNISVSHSYKYTSVLLGKDKKVGVDLEYMSHNIERIAHKFISNQEVISKDPLFRRKHLYLHWCAKEALYKIGDKADVSFSENLIIKPFEVCSQGDIIGIIQNDLQKEEYRMHYMLENNYALVYCTK